MLADGRLEEALHKGSTKSNGCFEALERNDKDIGWEENNSQLLLLSVMENTPADRYCILPSMLI